MRHLVLAIGFLLLVCCSPTTYTHGVPNLVQVRFGLWRSGQVKSVEDWLYLKSLGVRVVVKLNFSSEGSDDGARTIGLDVRELGIQPAGDSDMFDAITNTFVHPDESRLAEAERVIASGGGVLVHCTHGQDRTGLVIGRERVLFEHWSKDDAYQEMLANNFHAALHGLHESWESFQP